MSGRRSILVIDDDPAVARTFAGMLRLSGYDVLTALDAESGLRELSTAHPDAALIDLRMPMFDGVAFIRRLRAQEVEHQTPVAILTGDYAIGEAVTAELRALNAHVYFKPLWLHELIQITQRLLGDSRP